MIDLSNIEAAKAAFLEPSSTLSAIVACKGLLLPLLSALVDEMLAIGPQSCDAEKLVKVSLALLNALSIVPLVVEKEVLLFFRTFPSPSMVSSGESTYCAESMLLGLQASQELCELWEWYDILPLIDCGDERVRWYGMKCIGLVVGMGSVPYDGGFSHQGEYELQWKETLAKHHLYRNALYSDEALGKNISSIDFVGSKDGSRKHKRRQPDNTHQTNKLLFTCDRYIYEGGFAIPSKKLVDDGDCSLQPIQSQQEALKALCMALAMNKSSVVLMGPPSSGKSKMINYMAKKTGNFDGLIRVHLDDQMDSKTLLGGYICTSVPGEFTWAPGPIVRAMQDGRWLILENINLASSEVVTLLSSLAKRRVIEISSRGETVKARDGFQMIATCTILPGSRHNHFLHKSLISSCIAIEINELSPSEKRIILETLFPVFRPIFPRVLLVMEMLTIAATPFQGLDDIVEKLDGTRYLDRLRLISGKMDRVYSFRDVMKWGHRMLKLHQNSLVGMPKDAVDGDVALVPMAARVAAFIELADCVCLSIRSQAVRETILSIISDLLAVAKSTVQDYLAISKPEISHRGNKIQIGRAELQLDHLNKDCVDLSPSFAKTGSAMRLMERLAVSIACNEPILLVGETGVGKTTVIQEIARLTEKKFSVINLSQQTDSSDLIGGFRPSVPGDGVVEMMPTFIQLVKDTWKRGDNEEYISRIVKLGKKKKWIQLIKAYKAAIKKWFGMKELSSDYESRSAPSSSKKRNREIQSDESSTLSQRWEVFKIETDDMEAASSLMERGFAFGFTEGILVKAFKEGWWLLLDEINLAPTEVLEKVAGLLDSDQGWTLTERGDNTAIQRHPDFRIFAAMNPATDSGKKTLPALVRDRFTEFWVDEPTEKEDLMTIASRHLGGIALHAPVEAIVDLYRCIKGMSTLQDGAGVRPVYNLRTLTRALEYAKINADIYGIKRALMDGFSMSFQTQLDSSSSGELDRVMQLYLPPGASMQSVTRSLPAPLQDHILFDEYWVETGGQEPEPDESFIKTPTVKLHLRNLARAVLLKKYPILLQGPTSSGKTSLISHLAAVTGHKCIRINNHEHTDIQEYIGTYINDSQGRLRFHEGPLVQALRHGHWVILDELNLAPSEVLEALNRLLDDNRELFVPELQEVVKPNRHFMLFATQNPPGIYAGRKTLSRAFRSRFLELHVDDIPDSELHEILEKRCSVAPSYAKKMITVMRQLQRRRSASNVFAGRHGYITPRDLFRWAYRPAIGYEELALNGYYVLGERLRTDLDKIAVLQTLQTEMKVQIHPEQTYESKFDKDCDLSSVDWENIVWTPSFKRIYFLLAHSLENNEPALLIGETGIGKTTACQMLASSRGQRLHILNCNQHTETSDFLGGYRPNRSRKVVASKLRTAAEAYFDLPSDLNDVETIDLLARLLREESNAVPVDDRRVMLQYIESFHAPFEWVDGPLITAMRNGDILLIDELNLAEDAVLERLNSVLESSKTITLAEKCGTAVEVITGHRDFQIIATMNPGGDFGKKELSPALMNRFTSIWVPQLRDSSELFSILENRVSTSVNSISSMMIEFWRYFEDRIALPSRQNLTIREMLCWVDFINCMGQNNVDLFSCFSHGSEMVVIDGLGLGSGVDEELIIALQNDLRDNVRQICKKHGCKDAVLSNVPIERKEDRWGISPFFIRCNTPLARDSAYNFDTETTYGNLLRLLRAMQLHRPILLEGSPGVGKTTLVEAMSKAVGTQLIRVNLSDQTDMMDLLGANLPSAEGGPGDFVWSDGPLLQAMKSGAWVLLDELNLAGQSILEGLNALLDHRGEIFVPEINMTISCAPGFRLFGAQNPVQEGGGRKGLPKSFLNRFIRVRMSGFHLEDLVSISASAHQSIPNDVIQKMAKCLLECSSRKLFHKQPGLDFNLRDLLRWANLVERRLVSEGLPGTSALEWSRFYGDMLLVNRMRSPEDRQWVEKILDRNLIKTSLLPTMLFQSDICIGQSEIKIGNVQFGRRSWSQALSNPPLSDKVVDKVLLQSFSRIYQSLLESVKHNWLSILTGPFGSGKTTCVSILASLLGHKVIEIQLHQGTDISDLLGGFEQVDIQRDCSLFLETAKQFLRQLALHAARDTKALQSIKILWFRLFESKGNLREHSRILAQTVIENEDVFLDLISCAADQEGQLRTGFKKLLHSSRLHLENKKSSIGKFEWMDGTLTKCITNGTWVILRDANLCNPSVLDRLNSLFEPGGNIALNECGSLDYGTRVVAPHKDFRIFITYNSDNGDISRAMRNRGIEISIVNNPVTALPHDNGQGTVISDLLGIAGSFAIPLQVAEMIVTRWCYDSTLDKSKSFESFSGFCRLTHELVCQGRKFEEALTLSYNQIFKVKGISFTPSPPMDEHLDALNFYYSPLYGLYDGSTTDILMADWGFIVDILIHGKLPSEKYMQLLEGYGGMNVLNLAAFLLPGSFVSEGNRERMDTCEDTFNACFIVYIQQTSNFLGRMDFIQRIIRRAISASCSAGSHSLQEMASWDELITKYGSLVAPGSPNYLIRTILERCRLQVHLKSCDYDFEQCKTLLDACAWCQNRQTSQIHSPLSFNLLRWIWVAINQLYEVTTVCQSQDFCDSLSFFRRTLMLHSPTESNKEVLAHAWYRLVGSFEREHSKHRKIIPSGAQKVVEKVSLMMNPHTAHEDSALFSERFLEATGRPIVPLNSELHEILSQALHLIDITYLRNDTVALWREDSETMPKSIAVCVSPGIRSDILEACGIIFAGAISDASSADKIKDIVDKLKHLTSEKNLHARLQVLPDLDRKRKFLGHHGAIEQTSFLWDVVCCRSEINFARRFAWYSITNGQIDVGIMSKTASSILLQINEMPFRSIADALSYKIFMDYCQVNHEINNKSLGDNRIQKGLAVSVLLQAHRDIWQSTMDHTRRGSAILHTCAMTTALAQNIRAGSSVSLKHRISRLYQIERCISSIMIDHRECTSLEEWKYAVSLLAEIVQAIFEETVDVIELYASGDIEYLEDICKARHKKLDGVFLKGNGLAGSFAGPLKLSSELLLLNKCAMAEGIDGMFVRGKALSLLCLVQLHLSKPYKAFDPSLEGVMERNALGYISEQYYASEISIRRRYSSLPLSKSQESHIEFLNKQMEQLDVQKMQVKQLSSARPKISQYLDLQGELQNFIMHYAGETRINKIISDLEHGSGEAQAALWIENAEHFIRGANDNYPHYIDVLGPVELSLRGIQYGFDLMRTSKELSSTATACDKLVQVLFAPPGIDHSLTLSSLTRSMYSDAMHERDLGLLADRLMMFSLSVESLKHAYQHAVSRDQQNKIRSEFNLISTSIYEIWLKTMEEEKLRLAEEESQFEIKARELNIKTEELVTRRELSLLFPDDNETFDDLTADHEDQIDDGLVSSRVILNQNHVNRTQVSNILLKEVYEIFSLMNTIENIDPMSHVCGRSRRFNVGLEVLNRVDGLLPITIERLSIPGCLFELCTEYNNLTRTTCGSTNVEMYSSNIAESLRIQEPMEALVRRIEALLEEWPDHPILEQLAKICKRLLELPLNSPLKSFSTGVELLLNKAQIWEETAAKHVTLTELLQPLISISSSWRKMELDGWENLLLKVNKEVKDQAHESWFFLFGIVKEGVGSMAEFINTMDSFVQNSPVGQFHERLKILYMFGIHIKKAISERDMDKERMFMSRALLQLVCYYNQFICTVEEYICTEMRPLEKELSDFVALAKWEDRGFYAMKASVEKAQSRLYKIVRKAKDVLGRPCTACLRSESSRIGVDKNTFSDANHAGSGTKTLAASISRLVHKISVHPIATESRIGGNFSRRINGLANKYETVTCRKSLIFDGLNQSVINLDDLATSARYQAITLKDDGTKGAKSRKKKALSDYLKALEEQGISKLQSCVPLKERDPQYWLLEFVPCVDDIMNYLPFITDHDEFWHVADKNFYKSIASLNRLKEISQHPHQDIDRRELNVANNMAVHMVHCLMLIRRMIGKSLNELGFLQRSIFVLESPMAGNHRKSAHQYKSLQEALSSCLMATESYEKYLALLLESQQECLPLSKMMHLRSLMRTNYSKLDHWSTLLNRERAKSIEILDGEFFVTCSMKGALDDCQRSCASMCREIIGHCSENIPGIVDMTSVYENLLLYCDGDTAGPSRGGIPLSETVMIQCGEKLLDSCLIWAQQVSVDTIENANTVQLISSTMHLLALPSVKELNQKLKNAFESLYRSDEEFLEFKLLLVNLIPFIRAVQQQVENFILHLLSLHRAMSKLSLISISIFCSLVEHGFCTADDGDEESQDVDQTKDGTGLGDGNTKGAKDISNQLEDEDQLLGADFQQQDNDKGNDEGNENQEQHEKDQGIEMGDDFEGVMEDVQPEEPQHTEDEEEGDSEQLDQQIGDAENANEVDQRVWNEDDEEEKPVDDENKGNETQNNNEKEYAQGNEDDDQMNEEGSRDSADQDSKDDVPKDDIEGESDEKEDEEEGSDYNENVNTGFLELEMPENQLELPEDINLEQENDDIDVDSFKDDEDGDENISQDNEKDGASMEGMQEEMDHDVPDDSQDGIGDLDDKSTVEGESLDNSNEYPDDDGIDPDSGAQEDGRASGEKDEHDTVHGGPRDDEQGQDEENGDVGDGNATSKQGDVPLDKFGQGEEQENGSLEMNPFRSVNAAAEIWEKKNAIDLVDVEADDTDIAQKAEGENMDQEYRFVNDAEAMDELEANVMADATNEQAQQGVNHEIPEEQTEKDTGKHSQQEEMVLKESEDQKQSQNKTTQEKDSVPTKGEEELQDEHLPDAQDVMAVVSEFRLGEVKQQATGEKVCSGDVDDDEKKRLREELEGRIQLMSKEPIDGSHEQDLDLDYGRKVWSACEALTSQLSGELAEQLRLILEPTTASKLGGEYRSGKRINMKRVIGYIASHFRKDKIWMRRTQPDKRQYQVILAIDDSRSMAETSCGGFALESLTLICNAMSRIDIGDFGVIRFGGSIGADVLHQPGQPFSSTSDGAKIMSKMKFDADNTINDRPMVDVLTSMDAILEEQDHKVANTSSVLQQLVIILADGRFHEKESLKKAVMDATSRSGVMYAFIVLDSSSNSILDMQSVSFGVDGKPVFSKYIDSFPFPLYIVLQDIQQLPRALSDLLRQWIEYSANI